jgi:A/G-specific adenine glycosylase
VRLAEAERGPRTTASPDIAAAVLAWYDRHARRLPWRVGPAERAAGERPDPYRVWLSEVMLQQTTVAAAKPYFEKFLSQWPTVNDLATAEDDDVMRAWAGLGYYSRARNLIATAGAVAAERGRFPDNAEALKRLPGIGAYTAAAIAAIAFDRPEPVVDGNIERVIARLFAIGESGAAAKAMIRAHQAELTPRERPGDYAQAMMDLGATICTPKRPACSLCRLTHNCLAAASGDAETYPVKAEKAERPTRRGSAYVAVRSDGAVLLRRRPPKGLLGGMAEVPGSDWSVARPKSGAGAPLRLAWTRRPKTVVHVFTHFRLELDIYRGDAAASTATPADCWWSPADELAGEALPSVMKKAIEAALPGATKRRAPARGG